MEKVSVIVPVYNSEKYLSQCLNSIINQTYIYLEIIIVDDGSKDNSNVIYEKYAKRDGRVRLFKQENKGPSVARNKGITEATGDYIIFIDSDDYIEKDYIENIMKYTYLVDDNILVVSLFNCVNENGIKEESSLHSYDLVGSGLKNKEFLIDYSMMSLINSPWNKLYKLDKIKKNKLAFQEDVLVGEDLLFNLSYIKKNNVNKCFVIDSRRYCYRIHNESIMQKKKDDYYEITKKLFDRVYEIADYLKVNQESKDYLERRYITFLINQIRDNCSNNQYGNKRKRYKDNIQIFKNNKLKEYIRRNPSILDGMSKKYILIYKTCNPIIIWYMTFLIDGIWNIRRKIIGR